jgi:hypothetical protein
MRDRFTINYTRANTTLMLQEDSRPKHIRGALVQQYKTHHLGLSGESSDVEIAKAMEEEERIADDADKLGLTLQNLRELAFPGKGHSRDGFSDLHLALSGIEKSPRTRPLDRARTWKSFQGHFHDALKNGESFVSQVMGDDEVLPQRPRRTGTSTAGSVCSDGEERMDKGSRRSSIQFGRRTLDDSQELRRRDTAGIFSD